MRAIAADAGVDPRLISHFFGSKQELFVAVVELPFDPEPTFAALLDVSPEDAPARLAQFIVGLLDQPQARATITGLLRAAASEDAAAVQIRELISTRLLTPLAQRLGVPDPEVRAAMMGAQVVGLAFARHVVGIPALQEADPAQLVALLTGVFETYLYDH